LIRAALAAALLAAPASASGPVVVELFTSQGCSECPAADALLGELAQREDVIALSMHVDYWDYLGWNDTFASAANGMRQRRYVQRLGGRAVFTPQMVVHGGASVIGSRRGEVAEEIALAAAMPPAARVSIRREGDAVRIALEPTDVPPAGAAQILYVVYDRAQDVAIGRGENAARRLTYHNPVRHWMSIGHWSGGPAEFVAPRPEDAKGVAVLVQRSDGAILGARRFEFDATAISAYPQEPAAGLAD
jgi:hypothetical protein